MSESSEQLEAGITAAEFRHVMGHLPTGVAVLTALTEDGPVGLAGNSVASVSLEPPMVLFCPANSSSTWPMIRATGRFCINVVPSHGEAVTMQFSRKGADRFAGVSWHRRTAGPGLDEAVAWIDCAVCAEHEAGDHTVVIADVLAVEAAPEAQPLVFFRGRYGAFLQSGSEG